MIELKREDDADDLDAWEFLHDVLETLGEDGISSDESDIDTRTGTEVYYSKKMPWRRDVAHEMTIIDRERGKDRQIRSRRGAKEVVRVKNGAKGDTRRSAPTGRPKSFYDKEWLRAQSKQNRRALEISGEDFNWLDIC
jgi:hypothetical protein